MPRLLARQWRRRGCSPLHSRLPLRRPREAQRRLFSGGEVAQVHVLATAPHPRLVGLRLAGVGEVHAEIARLVVGHARRQPLRLRTPHQRSPTRRDRNMADATHELCVGTDRECVSGSRQQSIYSYWMIGYEAVYRIPHSAVCSRARLCGSRPRGVPLSQWLVRPPAAFSPGVSSC
eukprot:scaffold133536_cov69-Phaeocystis_antarctica.AAC.3